MKPAMTSSSVALRNASLISFGLAVAKTIAYGFSGSLLVLGSALDSLVDGGISYLNFRMYHAARTAADREHPFGHGGYEVLSSLIQGMLIAGSGVLLTFESVTRLSESAWDTAIHSEGLAMSAMVLFGSSAASWFIRSYLARKERLALEQQDRSLTILVDQAHYRADAYINFAAAIGLIIVWKWELGWLDAVCGLLGGLLFVKTAYPVLKAVFADIMQSEVDVDLQRQIRDIVLHADKRILGLHRLRARRFGPGVYIDFHMKLPHKMPLEQAHAIGEAVMRAVQKAIPRADLMIHLDPDSEPDDDRWEPAYRA